MVGIYFVVYILRIFARYLTCAGVTILKGPKRKIGRDVAGEAATNLKYSYITKWCQVKYVNGQDLSLVLYIMAYR